MVAGAGGALLGRRVGRGGALVGALGHVLDEVGQLGAPLLDFGEAALGGAGGLGIAAVAGLAEVVELAVEAHAELVEAGLQGGEGVGGPPVDGDPGHEGLPGRRQGPVDGPVFVHGAVDVLEEV